MFWHNVDPKSLAYYLWCAVPRTTDAQGSLFSLKYRTLGLGQTNWADKLWVIGGIFSQNISTHFGTVSPLSVFFIIQPLFLQKTKPLYPHPKRNHTKRLLAKIYLRVRIYCLKWVHIDFIDFSWNFFLSFFWFFWFWSCVGWMLVLALIFVLFVAC